MIKPVRRVIFNMEQKQFIQKLIEMSGQFEIERSGKIDLSGTHNAYEGTPKKHPANDNILVLFTDPAGTEPGFYEFSVNTIGAVEELGTATTLTGQSYFRIRVWIRKGSPALRAEKFIVE